MSLRIEAFAAFHRAVHKQGAFEWQERLLQEIDTKRCWPRVLDLPTGAGKTTCIDIALFALALDAQRPHADRWCPRRIAMVVDRRVVVDQVAERGRKLLIALTTSNDATVAAVRDALASLTQGEEEPLAVFTLRGGIPKDDGWARTPHQPLVLASTVDQLGSRLLIQGYGVSKGMRPVHAGLLANDTLVLLDEVHLSRPFADTLDAMKRFRGPQRPASAAGLPARFHHVFLSATPGSTAEPPFRLEAKERTKSAPLGRRLHAKKPARLEAVKLRDLLAGKCAALACELLGRHDVVGVVLNRVASARETAARLRSHVEGAVDVVLLTGRMRPLDRDDILRRWRHRIVAGRERADGLGKLVVVGTQCIEAGADFDFDAMVCESASLDALRQRFGRLDRLGYYGRAEAVVVHVEEVLQAADKVAKGDPIYGIALATTWKWLKKQQSVDFGIEHLPIPENIEELVAPRKNAPTLLPAYLDLWMQTSPEPAVVPDPALFLHGPASGPADVQVVWRADLEEAHLARAGPDIVAAVIVGSVRPSSLEAVSVPYAAAQAWLRGDRAVDVFDVDSVFEARLGAGLSASQGALRWRGKDSEVIDWKGLRPGDTIVVPCSRGGLRDASFDPSCTESVVDLAERATLLSRGRPVLRIHPNVFACLGLPSVEDTGELRGMARALLAIETVPWRRAWLAGLSGRQRRTVVDAEGLRASWLVVEGDRLSARDLRRSLGDALDSPVESGADLTTDDEDSFHAGRAGITLAEHSSDVEAYARKYAVAIGLTEDLVADLSLAGWLHDIGKADSRFQLLLRGGDEVEFYKDERLWAKSVMRPADKRAQALALRRSSYPRGARHEVLSVAMIEGVRGIVAAKAHDLELVLHLVGSHHGYCRPFAPAVADVEPVNVVLDGHTSAAHGQIDFPATNSDHRLHRLDSPLAERFWRLVERYGWLELCWLETILRLADHRASESEEAKHQTDGAP